eukprot:8451251-Alexandrium_andersonii.AAC.1
MCIRDSPREPSAGRPPPAATPRSVAGAPPSARYRPPACEPEPWNIRGARQCTSAPQASCS